MSHSTEVTFHAGLSTYTTETGSRRLAEAFGVVVNTEVQFINQDAVDLVLDRVMDEYLPLVDQLVIKTMVQAHQETLQRSLNNITRLNDHMAKMGEHYAAAAEKELQNFPVFKLQIKHCD